jgi:DNA-binding PadR family transcriptional regulator
MGEGLPFTPEDVTKLTSHMRAVWLSMAGRPDASRRPGRAPGGRGWGPGGPFGPDFPWMAPRGRRPGWPFEPERARAARGDARLAILALLEEGPRHGYQLIQDIRERSGGAWNPSPGSIYPALSALQDEGLIDDDKVDGRRVFALTDAGRRYVAERAEDLARVFADNTAAPEHEEIADLRELIWGVGGAAVTVIGSGTPEQREQARVILSRTRRDLYRILAEEAADLDEPDDQPGAGQQ